MANKYTALNIIKCSSWKPIIISRTFRSTSTYVLSYNHSWRSIWNNLRTSHSTNTWGSVSISSLQNVQTSLSTMFHWNSYSLLAVMKRNILNYTIRIWVHFRNLYIHLKLFSHSPSWRPPGNHSSHFLAPLGVMLLYDCSIKSL